MTFHQVGDAAPPILVVTVVVCLVLFLLFPLLASLSLLLADFLQCLALQELFVLNKFV